MKFGPHVRPTNAVKLGNLYLHSGMWIKITLDGAGVGLSQDYYPCYVRILNITPDRVFARNGCNRKTSNYPCPNSGCLLVYINKHIALRTKEVSHSGHINGNWICLRHNMCITEPTQEEMTEIELYLAAGEL